MTESIVINVLATMETIWLKGIDHSVPIEDYKFVLHEDMYKLAERQSKEMLGKYYKPGFNTFRGIKIEVEELIPKETIYLTRVR